MKKLTSGIGLKLAEMTEPQFKAHTARVIGRMTAHGAPAERVKEARARMNTRRQQVIAEVSKPAKPVKLAKPEGGLALVTEET